MKKRMMAILLGLVLAVSMLAGCGGNGDDKKDDKNQEEQGKQEEQKDTSGSDVVTIKFSHPDPEGSVLDRGVKAFAKDVEERSGGTIKVDVYPANQLGSLTEVIEGIQMGSVDMAFSNTSYVTSFCPEVGVFDMPFLIDDDEHAYAALDGDVGTDLAATLEGNNIKVLSWWPMGFRNLTTTEDKKIESVDDINGLTVRTMTNEIHQKMFLMLGANPVTIDWNELFTALQQGVCDAQENPINMIYNNNVYEVQHYLYNTEHAYAITVMMISPSTWSKLSDEQKEWVQESAEVATKSYREDYKKETETNLKKLTEECGMEYIELDKEELREKTKSVYDEYPELADYVEKVKSYSTK